jgi:hypothetical protein
MVSTGMPFNETSVFVCYPGIVTCSYDDFMKQAFEGEFAEGERGDKAME